jgi:hypothetical protein
MAANVDPSFLCETILETIAESSRPGRPPRGSRQGAELWGDADRRRSAVHASAWPRPRSRSSCSACRPVPRSARRPGSSACRSSACRGSSGTSAHGDRARPQGRSTRRHRATLPARERGAQLPCNSQVPSAALLSGRLRLGAACRVARKRRSFACYSGISTEGEGFEPSNDESAVNGFRDRRFQPLSHPSGGTSQHRAADAATKRLPASPDLTSSFARLRACSMSIFTTTSSAHAQGPRLRAEGGRRVRRTRGVGSALPADRTRPWRVPQSYRREGSRKTRSCDSRLRR